MQTYNVYIKWSPSYISIKGNKETDRLADKRTNIIQLHNDIRDEPTINRI
jgi:hypothetical protein